MKSVEISNQNLITLFGAYDCNAKHIEQSLNVRLIPFDGELLNILLDELVADGAFVRRDDGYVALPNWSDFRFDFNI